MNELEEEPTEAVQPEARIGTPVLWTRTDQAIALLKQDQTAIAAELALAKEAAARVGVLEKKLKAIAVSIATLGEKSEQRKPRAVAGLTDAAVKKCFDSGVFEGIDIDRAVGIVREQLKSTGVLPLPLDGTIRKSILRARAARRKDTESATRDAAETT